MKTIAELQSQTAELAIEMSEGIAQRPFMRELEHKIVGEFVDPPSTNRGMSAVFRLDIDEQHEAAKDSLRKQLMSLFDVDARYHFLTTAMKRNGGFSMQSRPVGARWIGNIAAGDWKIEGAQFDTYPLRFDELDEARFPKLFEPEVIHATTHGSAARINPLWSKAAYEVQFAFRGEPSMRRICKVRACHIELTVKTVDQQRSAEGLGDLARYYYQMTRDFDETDLGGIMVFAALRNKPSI